MTTAGPPMPGIIMEPVTPPRVYYFGCGLRAGHWWYAPPKEGQVGHPSSAVASAMRTLFPDIDSNFAPQDKKYVEGEAKLSFVRGWTVLAWWDNSVDARPNSNSALVVDRQFDFDHMLVLLDLHFPHVARRQRAPIKWVQMEVGA